MEHSQQDVAFGNDVLVDRSLVDDLIGDLILIRPKRKTSLSEDYCVAGYNPAVAVILLLPSDIAVKKASVFMVFVLFIFSKSYSLLILLSSSSSVSLDLLPTVVSVLPFSLSSC